MPSETAWQFLQSWYRSRCDGTWEHGLGVTIESLATPGWMVTIDLIDTTLELTAMPEFSRHHAEDDWIVCRVHHKRFQGEGDPRKLNAILEVFQNWAGQTLK